MTDTLPFDSDAVKVARVLAGLGADGRAAHCMPDLGWEMAARLAGVELTKSQRAQVVDVLHREAKT